MISPEIPVFDNRRIATDLVALVNRLLSRVDLIASVALSLEALASLHLLLQQEGWSKSLRWTPHEVEPVVSGRWCLVLK